MSDADRLKSLSSFEWSSVSQYMVYISSAAGLREINLNHVYSLPLSLVGADAVIRRKRRVLSLLEQNKQKLERFVGFKADELEEDEKVILRTIYVQILNCTEVVQNHIEVVKRFKDVAVCQGAFDDGGAQDDDLF